MWWSLGLVYLSGNSLAGLALEVVEISDLCTLAGCASQVVLVPLGRTTQPPPRDGRWIASFYYILLNNFLLLLLN